MTNLTAMEERNMKNTTITATTVNVQAKKEEMNMTKEMIRAELEKKGIVISNTEFKATKKAELEARLTEKENSGYSVNPLDDPEVKAMDVSDDALLKPIDAVNAYREVMAQINPGYIAASVKEEVVETEVTVPVGDLEVTSDKMVIEKEEVKMEQKKVVATKETKEELICQLLLVEWCLQSTVEPYVAKDGKKYRLFFPAKSDKYEKGTYMSMEGPAKKVAFSVFDTVYGKNWGTIGVYKLWAKMASYGFCHMVQGNSKAREENSLVRDKDGNTIWVYFVHMSTKEREKLVKQYKRIEANANNAGFTGIDAARQYVLAKLSK
jgi:hypothetical protein